MKILKRDYDTFMEWAQQYFITAREAKVKQVVAKFSEEYKTAANRMTKQVKKIGLPAYIGRHIFRNIPWLKSEKGKWLVHSGDDYCAYCLNELDEEIYLFDLNDHYYCDYNCMEEMFSLMSDLEDDEETEHLAVEVEEPWDSFWSDCVMLFEDFENLKLEARRYVEAEMNATAKNYLDVVLLIEKIESVIYSGDYDSVWMNGGDDGPSSWHTYRMLQSLEKDRNRLVKVAEKLKFKRDWDEFYNNFWCAFIDDKYPKNEVMKVFNDLKEKYDECIEIIGDYECDIHDYEGMCDAEKAFEELNIEVTITEFIDCPLCFEVEAYSDATRGIDDAYYCNSCYQYYEEEFEKYSERGRNW